MSEHENIISSLNNKALKMISAIQKLKAENASLKAELEKVNIALKSKELDCHDLNVKYENLKLAKVIQLSGGDLHDAKIKVNRIVREIDKCISLLNR
jgi:predicted  nucleic acid-binding Zn-ribbon protein